MSVRMPTAMPRLLALLLALVVALPTAAVASAAIGGPQVIEKAVCDGYQKGGGSQGSGCSNDKGPLAGFTNATKAIIDPAVIAMIAIAPIACLVGAASMMFGSRRGVTIIGAALGTLVFVISIKGIVA